MSTKVPLLIALLFAMLLLSGCSVLGYGFGADMEPRTYAADELLKVIPGLSVVVHHHSGTAYTGQYLGLDTLDGGEVSARYAEVLTTRSVSDLPAWGTEVQYVSVWGWRREGTFHGFGVKPDEESRYVTGAESHYMRLRTVDDRVVDVEIDQLRKATDAEGHTYDLARWHQLIAERRIPVITALSLNTLDGGVLVPLDQVARTDRLGKAGARYKGLLIGALIDAGIMAYGMATIEITPTNVLLRF